jgi:peptide/nickel transport system permease protein
VTGHIIRRLLQLIPTVLGVTVIVFLIMHLAPGDPAAIMLGERANEEDIALIRARLGLDKPLHVQYVVWLSKILRGDFGRSIHYKESVSQLLLTRAMASIQLLAFAIIVSLVLGVTTGIISAVKQYSLFDYAATVLALFGVSMASFWFALLLMLVFGLYLKWFPTFGYGSLRHIVLPGMTLALLNTALITRLTRSSMLEVVGQDYITTARAKGLPERAVIYRHALRNALIPIVTIIALRIPWMFAGAMITETVFAWPGTGQLLVKSVLDRDFPLVQGAAFVIAVLVIFSSLIADISYAFINPRIRYE